MELNPFVDVLQVAVPVLYGVLVLLYGVTFFWNAPSVEGYKIRPDSLPVFNKVHFA